MKKKLIAVAVAGALGVPGVALAQASTVQIYGTLILNYNYLDKGNAAPNVGSPKVDMFNAHDTNIGFKGEEALGGGTSAWFQCESTMDVSGQGSANGSAAFCGRNSAFGIKGGFGNVYAGIWDTPMKIAMANFRPFSTSGAYGMGALMWNEAQSNIGNTAYSFTRRQNNLWSYQSPNMSGFQVGAAFSATNEATAQTNASTIQKARLWGLGATYTNGPLIVGGGYEKHSDYNPGAQTTYTGGNDVGWSVGVAYTFMGTLKASLMYADAKYDLAGGKDLKHDAWSLHMDWAIAGPHRVRAGYTHANDTKGSAIGNVNQYVGNNGAGGTKADLWALQYAFAFSKRTELNFGYAYVNNGDKGIYRLQTLGPAPAPGETQSAWVMGAKHSF
jgi:predicted porin